MTYSLFKIVTEIISFHFFHFNFIFSEFVDGVVGETNGNSMVKPDASGSPAKAATSPTSSLDPATNEVEPVKVESETDAKVPSKKEEETCASVTETKPEITEKTEEKEPIDELNSKQKNQLNQRELFLSKQVEILPATNIRGKCTVTLLNETESFSSYIDKEVFSFHFIDNPQISFLIFGYFRMPFFIRWYMTQCNERS